MHLETQLTRIFTFTGTRLHHFSGNTVHSKTLVYRAYIVCSDKQQLESELNCLREVFHNFNSYPHRFMTKVVNEVIISA